MDLRNSVKIALVNAIESVKNRCVEVCHVDENYYLGGDLGIDSVEMLEIWFEMCNELQVQIPDEEKRDLYTVGDVITVFVRHLHERAVA